jgi:MoxR-like ATPase
VALEDLSETALPSLRHRILLNFEGEVAKITPDDIILDILKRIRPA